MGSQPFKAGRHGVKVGLSQPERALLAGLIEDVARLLEESLVPSSAPADGAQSEWDVLAAALAAPAPSDPAVARLLPEGHRDDAELAAGYRRLTEHSLREKKQGALSTAAVALRREGQVVLTQAEAGALLKSLTDVRLVIAERLGVRTDEDAEALHRALQAMVDSPDAEPDEWLGAAALYDALTWWQESLVGALR